MDYFFLKPQAPVVLPLSQKASLIVSLHPDFIFFFLILNLVLDFSTEILHSPSKLFSSIQFSHSVVFDSLQLHGLQHARPPCPSPTPGVYSNSCPLSW